MNIWSQTDTTKDIELVNVLLLYQGRHYRCKQVFLKAELLRHHRVTAFSVPAARSYGGEEDFYVPAARAHKNLPRH
jgi:hypothetical protein